MEQLCASPKSELVGKTLSEMNARRELGVIVLAIRRADGQMVFNPPADARIAAGDYLIAMGEQAGLRLFENALGG